MAIEIIVEDGTGLDTANSYVSVEYADAFHEASLNGAAWATKTDTQKMQALITATRMLDQLYIWNGQMVEETQALQWPRIYVNDPDHAGGREYMPDDEIPAAIQKATALYALALFAVDYESLPQGQGISSFSLDGVMSVSFDPATVMELVPAWIRALLNKYGALAASKSRDVRVVRT